jgi:L-threonylcarbamoyladenylate synthase
VIPYRSDAETAAAIPGVVAHLVRRGLIGYPTETVYGLGSTVRSSAVSRLAALKGRQPGKPFLLLVAGPEMLRDVGLRLTDAADRFASAFWPGPLTLVLPGGEGVLPDTLRGPEGGIAVRWTSHAGIAQLIATLGSPITSTSANRPGEAAAQTATDVAAMFAPAVADGSLLVLDAGALAASAPSTVVDCTGLAPRLIRRGALEPSRLRAIVPGLLG